MKTSGQTTAALGWFGKIPSLGDFTGRGLPPSFVDAWDSWLSLELSQTRALWADDWARAYRAAPVICFSLGPDVIDAQAWHGVMLASVDRVEREFPFTLAQSRAAQLTPPQRSWWIALAAAGLKAQARSGGVEAVETALHSIRSDTGATSDDPSPDMTSLAVGHCKWWTLPVDSLAAAALLSFESTGLPRGAQFRRLFGEPGVSTDYRQH